MSRTIHLFTIYMLFTLGILGCGDSAETDTDGAPPVDMRSGDSDAMPATDKGIQPDRGPGVDMGGPPERNPFLPRIDNTTCALPSPPPLGAMETESVWPNHRFRRPLWFGTAPGAPDLRFVLEQRGRVMVFDTNGGAASTFLQLRVSRSGNEEGLLGLAFHPNYAQNHTFYLYYSAANPRRSVLSAFQADPRDPTRALPDSEQILMQIPEPYGNHNGGDLRFGPDGMLYISVGDGGAGGDPHGNGQNPDTLLGSILRIDVNQPDAHCDTPYSIPDDNPFAIDRCTPGNNTRAEIWAWGLRNVWRMSFDPSTGELWAGDVGQDLWEEINIVEAGQNYGWNPMEGDQCFQQGCDPAMFIPPIWVYDHGEGESVTGGFVYRGQALPELFGAYIFGDYQSGRIWALQRTAGAPEVTLLVDSDLDIASFGEDPDGEIIIVAFNNGRSLHRLRRRPDAPPPAEPFPELLSQTGCFSDTASHTLADGVLPYEVNYPLWSDNAEKLRYLAIPAGSKMFYAEDQAFGFPLGSILMKSFMLRAPDDTLRRLETRLYHRSEFGWRGYTYRWNDEQTDAVLLPGQALEAVEGPNGPQEWQFPSRVGCDGCHTPEAGFALGLTVHQLNRMVTRPDAVYDQLLALRDAGYIDLPNRVLPRFPLIDDQDAPLEDLARAALDVNCAPCHQPGGAGNAQIDLRSTTPLNQMGLCDVEPGQGDLGLPNARLIAPGAPERSVLLERMRILSEDRMPPLGTGVLDTFDINLIGAWIQSLPGCP